MAVYKRGYERYEGRLTPEWSRSLTIARQAYRRVFNSRLLITYLALCFICPVVCALIMYLPHNAGALKMIPGANLISIRPGFFLGFMHWQGWLGFVLTAFIGPGLVSADLANNALPLYFARPFSRTEYVVGKMSVLAILLSFITWIPGLMLFAFQSYLAGPEWFWANLHVAYALFVGFWIWIILLSLLALAMSAWVKWKLAAGALILAIVFVAAGFGEAFNSMVHTQAGRLINVVQVIDTIWSSMLGMANRSGISPEHAWMSLAAGCALCLHLLSRKIRAYEVERS
jgi:ABC-2 type transport system permease protein